MRRALVVLLTLASATGCTDWEALGCDAGDPSLCRGTPGGGGSATGGGAATGGGGGSVVEDAGPGEDGGVVDAGVADAGAADAGAPDAGDGDAGAEDAGTEDAGAVDAGAPDAGPADAGVVDAGAPDAGPDAGPPTPQPDGGLTLVNAGVFTLSQQPGAGSIRLVNGRLEAKGAVCANNICVEGGLAP